MKFFLSLIVLIIASGLQADTFFRTYDVEGGTEYFRNAVELPNGGFAGMRVHSGAYKGLMFFDVNGDSTAYIDEIYTKAFCLTDDSCLVFVTGIGDWVLLWTDFEGNILDEVLITGILPAEDASDIVQAVDGGFFLCGEDELVVKVDSSGTYEWHLSFDALNITDLWSVAQIEDGTFLAGGQAYDTVLMDYIVNISSDGIVLWEWTRIGVGILELQAVTGGFTASSVSNRITMFSTAGDTLWSYSSEYGDVEYSGIAVSGTDIIACGSSESDSLSVITRLDSNGFLIWEQDYPSCGFHSIGGSVDGGLILSGVYPYPFGPWGTETASILVKTDSEGWFEGMGIEPEQTAGSLNLKVYPNPASAYTVLCFVLDSSAPVGMMVFDISGRCVLKFPETQFHPGENEILIDGLDSGLYFCRLTSGDFLAAQRFVVIE